MTHGGARPGGGRKSKAEEIKLIEKLSPMAEDAYQKLHEGVKRGEFAFIKLFLEYYAGKPTDSLEVEHSGSVETIPLDPSKLSTEAIKAILDARGGHNPQG